MYKQATQLTFTEGLVGLRNRQIIPRKGFLPFKLLFKERNAVAAILQIVLILYVAHNKRLNKTLITTY